MNSFFNLTRSPTENFIWPADKLELRIDYFFRKKTLFVVSDGTHVVAVFPHFRHKPSNNQFFIFYNIAYFEIHLRYSVTCLLTVVNFFTFLLEERGSRKPNNNTTACGYATRKIYNKTYSYAAHYFYIIKHPHPNAFFARMLVFGANLNCRIYV